jgi:Amt family ammonium transporter
VDVNAGDTAWVLVSAGLVLFMTPGLAFFYGGMVRGKSVLAIMGQCFGVLAVVSVVWMLLGYTLAFGSGGGGFIGGLKFAGFANAQDPVPGYTLTIPPMAFAAFQMMFCVITAALLAGTGADRMKFGSFLTFTALWALVVYVPLAHWVFSPNGWLAQMGVLDFAGGSVVEMNSGASALALAIVLGRRRGWPGEPMPPHSLPLSLVGAGVLWFGWFGFNAGSALSAGSVAAQALISTQLAACMGLLGWIAVEKVTTRHATTLGAASGAVAGLVAITPAAGFVNSVAALFIGLGGGVAAALAVRVKFRLGYDDSLDVVGVHGVAGIVGTLAVGLFATRTVNGAISHEGVFSGGGWHLLGVQALTVVITIAFAFSLTWVVGQVVHRVLGLRVPPQEEIDGLDTHTHLEAAYDFGAVRAGARIPL